MAEREPEVDQPSGVEGFDGDRAFADLVDLVRIGPRPPGSPGAESARTLIRERLRQAGWVTRNHDFTAQPPGRPSVAMTNVIGARQGARDDLIVVGAHYDTKAIPGVRFLGANDGASGTAVLLELARQLGAGPLPCEVWLVFFDGEEAFGPQITRADGLYGSRALADSLAADGTLARVAALLVVDMVGDADLNLMEDRNSSAALRGIAREAAMELGLASLLGDPAGARQLTDDHVPFLRKGVSEVLLLIDFEYGARTAPGPWWHTAADDLDKVSAESLNSAGRLLVEVVQRTARRLGESERAAAH